MGEGEFVGGLSVDLLGELSEEVGVEYRGLDDDCITDAIYMRMQM